MITTPIAAFPRPLLNIRPRIELQPFYNPSVLHMRGMPESDVSNLLYEGGLNFYVKIHRQDLELARSLSNPRICLLRIPKKRHKLGSEGTEWTRGWNHPSHLNGAPNGISSKRYGGGIQKSGTSVVMNPIVTEWVLDTSRENISTICTISPLDWYRRKSLNFGDPVMPVSRNMWKTDGVDAIRLRGKKNKKGKWAGLTEQFKFKIRIEATDPADPDKRIISSISTETLILFPKLGTFEKNGMVYNETIPATQTRIFFGFGLKFAP
jgi:hypothetical protein